MYKLLSVLAGALVAVMVAVNGELSSFYGVYSSTVVIHAVGLFFVLILIAIKHKRVFPVKRQPLHLYLGGAVGVANVVFCNIAFGRISVSAIIALGLLGQILTSLVFDKYGFLNMSRHPFHKSKIIGIAVVMSGIVVMLTGSKADAFVPVILSLLTGLSVVLSRTINASLSQRTNALAGTLFNYVVGLCVSAAILLAAGASEPMMAKFTLSPRAWIYLGGIVGVGVVTLLNAIVCKISSFYMTLLMFAGQMFAGVIADIALTGSFSVNNLLGGLLITAGLAQNLIVDRRAMASPGICS